jgi:hypothetical protein
MSHQANLAKTSRRRNSKTEALKSARENVRQGRSIAALVRENRALTISPAPAVSEPHASRPSASHPGDTHAHAIITAPMTNKRSEPIANLRSHGINKS